MSIFKRGNVYWFHFLQDGRHIQRSSRQGSPRVARQIEAAYRTQLAKGEVGIEDRKKTPIVREFGKQFLDEIRVKCAAKPATIEFYECKWNSLVEFEPLSGARLDHVDEALIARFVQWKSKKVKPATVNRCLATLRRSLRLALKWRLIPRSPHFEMLPGERSREFVLNGKQEADYLLACPDPLKSVSTLILDTGLRVGEALGLRWADVHLDPVGHARRGYIHIRSGKSRNAKRNVSLTARAVTLLRLMESHAVPEYVFVRPDKLGPLSRSTVDHQHERVRTSMKLPTDFVIHSLRHTMLTRLGEAGVDAFTIMKIAGHSSIAISQRYIHPTPETLERAIDQMEGQGKANAKEARKRAARPLAPSTASVGQLALLQ